MPKYLYISNHPILKPFFFLFFLPLKETNIFFPILLHQRAIPYSPRDRLSFLSLVIPKGNPPGLEISNLSG